MNGKLISIEGPDTAGKSTQIAKLKEALEAQGIEVVHLHFPNYGSPYGRLILEFLNDKEACRTYHESYALQTLYIADQIATQDEIISLLRKGVYVLLDRYDLSTMVYSVATLSLTEGETAMFVRESPHSTVRDISVMQHQLKRPDVTFILDLNPEEIRRRKTTLDAFEENERLMEIVSRTYRELGTEEKYLFGRELVHIEATNTEADIHQTIMATLARKEMI